MTVDKFADEIEDGIWKLPFRMNRNKTILLDAENGIIVCFEMRWELRYFLGKIIHELRRRQMFKGIR